MPDKQQIVLSEEQIAEIEAMFPHAEYQPTLSPDEVDPCEFCKGAIDDHKANCVVPHVRALCQTVRALHADNRKWQRAAGHWKAQHEVAESRLAEAEKERNALRGLRSQNVGLRTRAIALCKDKAAGYSKELATLRRDDDPSYYALVLSLRETMVQFSGELEKL